jgi:4-alpha-glucanotransferase
MALAVLVGLLEVDATALEGFAVLAFEATAPQPTSSNGRKSEATMKRYFIVITFDTQTSVKWFHCNKEKERSFRCALRCSIEIAKT